MFYILDQYDSFVYNLSAYLREEGQEVVVRRADAMSLSEIHTLHPKGILLSPGPKRPSDAIEAHQVLREFQNKIPVFGVCLGHQVICQFYGAAVCKGVRPMHGKIAEISHNNTGLFSGLPRTFSVTRYHSLAVSDEAFPDVLRITARSADGVIMGVSHRRMPVYGVQFHPEAVLTEYGHELMANFVKICEKWRSDHVSD